MWSTLIILIYTTLQTSATSTVTRLDACTSPSCADWYGRCHSNGTKWTDDDTWVYECQNGDTRFTGCRGTARAQNAIIPPGQRITVDGFWFMCTMLDDVVVYEQEARCNVEGDMYHLNDTYRRGTFEWVCLRTGLWVVACHYTDAQTKQDVRVPVGSSSDEGKIRHNCRRISDNPGRIQYWTDIIDTGSPDDTAIFAGRGQSGGAPDPVDQRLDAPPQPWLHEYADNYVIMDGSFDVKMRFLNPSEFKRL